MRKTERPCHDRQENGARTSRIQLWEVTDAPVRKILDAALGVRVIVHKEREVWQKDNVKFNPDTVEDVGQDIAGSNEDLAPPVPPRRF